MISQNNTIKKYFSSLSKKTPKIFNGSAEAPSTPPVNHEALEKKSSIINCAARVAIAKYKPLTLAAGIPNNKPTIAEKKPPKE